MDAGGNDLVEAEFSVLHRKNKVESIVSQTLTPYTLLVQIKLLVLPSTSL